VGLVVAVAAWSSAGATTAAAEVSPPTRPNIVVILVDDMGFSDLGCTGGEIPTPHLDALAAEGLTFTRFCNTGRCCPTRASLLTGLYPHQAGVGYMTDDEGLPGYRGRLGGDCVTIAESLRDAGYFTCMAGKWHVGQNHGVAPWNRGFLRSLNPATGGFYQAGSPRYELSLDGAAIAAHDSRLPPNWYSTDLWTEFGLRFIDDARAVRKPFFLYLAHNAPHFPLQAPAEAIERFRATYAAGWDALAARRFERQVEAGLFTGNETPAGRPVGVAAWDQVPEAERQRFTHLMATYAATVHLMDRSVGTLVTGLRDRDLLDDTLILFLSDNGGNAESGPAGRTVGDPTKPDSSWFCGESWAWLQNTPLRRFKHYAHEGGIATPLIAHWPRGIAARGERRRQPGHVIDILPTCLEVAGAAMPATREGVAVQPLEGRSLVPAFHAETGADRRLFWEHEGNAAVSDGDTKLVRLGRDGPWELYDLVADRTESHDLAAAQPEKVRELTAAWEQWAERVHAVPMPDRRKTKPRTR
jgi:arylsulfatase